MRPRSDISVYTRWREVMTEIGVARRPTALVGALLVVTQTVPVCWLLLLGIASSGRLRRSQRWAPPGAEARTVSCSFKLGQCGRNAIDT